MRFERIILIAFLGNYLINNVATATVALLGFSGGTQMQYVIYITLAAVATSLFTWWYLKPLPKERALMDAMVFGVSAFVIAVLTAVFSGIASVLAQTGSVAQLATVVPNFIPFIMNWATLAILGYWVVPAVFMGWILMKKRAAGASPTGMMRGNPIGSMGHNPMGGMSQNPPRPMTSQVPPMQH